MRLALALFVAILLNTVIARGDVTADLTKLQAGWIDVCVMGTTGPVKECVSNARKAVASMRVTFAESDLHVGLTALTSWTIQSCSNDLGILKESVMTTILLAQCVDDRFKLMIEHQGGTLGYLLWFETLGELKFDI